MKRALIAGILLWGCSSGDTLPDATPGERQLVLVTPSGGTLGLFPADRQSLRVAYRTLPGAPVGGSKVSFAIYGDPVGSSLSADSAVTDPNGLASIEVRAAATTASFYIIISAAYAEDRRVDVAVSNEGFVSLRVSTVYTGDYSTSQVQTVQCLLYDNLSCAGLGTALGQEPIRSRDKLSVGETHVFQNLPSDSNYALRCTGRNISDQLYASGCLSIPNQLLPPSLELSVSVDLVDEPLTFEGRYQLKTTFGLPNTLRPLAGALAPWANLTDCNYDPAQLLLDCIVDALSDPQPDCIVNGTMTAEAAAVAAERGSLQSGCRGSKNDQGSNSLERLLQDKIEDNDPTLNKRLAQTETSAVLVLTQFSLKSTLQLSQPDGNGTLVATHQPNSLSFTFGGASQTYALTGAKGEAGKPIGVFQPSSGPVAAIFSNWQLAVGEHSFSLPFGLMAADALETFPWLGLQLSSLSNVPHKIVDTIHNGNLTGCEAIDAVVCLQARLSAGCLSTACPKALGAMATYLRSGFSEMGSESGTITLSGLAHVSDPNGDRVIENIGSTDEPGIWLNSSLVMGDESFPASTASFTGLRLQSAAP
jgi:hypothetical protein